MLSHPDQECSVAVDVLDCFPGHAHDGATSLVNDDGAEHHLRNALLVGLGFESRVTLEVDLDGWPSPLRQAALLAEDTGADDRAFHGLGPAVFAGRDVHTSCQPDKRHDGFLLDVRHLRFNPSFFCLLLPGGKWDTVECEQPSNLMAVDVEGFVETNFAAQEMRIFEDTEVLLPFG